MQSFNVTVRSGPKWSDPLFTVCVTYICLFDQLISLVDIVCKVESHVMESLSLSLCLSKTAVYCDLKAGTSSHGG